MKEIREQYDENEYTVIIYADGTKEKVLTAAVKTYGERKEEKQPTQLDRIEEAVKKSQQDIIDEYTLELIEGGVI